MYVLRISISILLLVAVLIGVACADNETMTEAELIVSAMEGWVYGCYGVLAVAAYAIGLRIGAAT